MEKSVSATTKLSLDEVREQKSRTDWARVRSMCDAELTTNAQSDADAPPLDEEFFDKATRLDSVQFIEANTTRGR